MSKPLISFAVVDTVAMRKEICADILNARLQARERAKAALDRDPDQPDNLADIWAEQAEVSWRIGHPMTASFYDQTRPA